ncbi:MAG: hypothetical protein ACR2GB_05380 [Nocardioidaceae bacterium]
MSLADRLAQAQLDRGTATPTNSSAEADGQRKRIHSTEDPFGELKRTVHQRLVTSIGPKL